MFTDANGLTFYVELHGDEGAEHRILNIGGTGGDLRTSMPDRNPLNTIGHVLHYDQRGLGQTSKPAGPHEMSDYADDAAAVVRAIGWERCHVVGTSFGGMVAQHLAIRHPDLVQRLVLNCTSPGGTQPSFPLHTLEELDAEARIELMLGLLDNRWDPGRDDPIPGLPNAFYDTMIQGYRTPRTGEARTGYLAQLDARSRHDTQRRLGEITAPTLVAAGAFDDLAPPPNSEALAEAIPDASVEFFDGGHLFMLQDRTAYPRILEFLQD